MHTKRSEYMLTYDTLMDICSALPDEIKTALEPTFRNIEFETKALDALRKDSRTVSNPAMKKAFRDLTQTYQQDIKLVLWQLRNNETSTADELLSVLRNFE